MTRSSSRKKLPAVLQTAAESLIRSGVMEEGSRKIESVWVAGCPQAQKRKPLSRSSPSAGCPSPPAPKCLSRKLRSNEKT